MQAADLRENRHVVPRGQAAIAVEAPGHVVLDRTAARSQCARTAATSGIGQLPIGLDRAAHAAAGHRTAGQGLLNGWMEVGKTYLIRTEHGVGDQQSETKALIAIALEVRHDGSGLGRNRMRVVKDSSARSLRVFVRWAV